MNKFIFYLFILCYLLSISYIAYAYPLSDWVADRGTIIASDEAGNLGTGYEPSGILWHEGLKQLFVVSDDGYVSKINLDTIDVKTWITGGDLEALAVADDTSNFIYLGIENPDGIKEFDVKGMF